MNAPKIDCDRQHPNLTVSDLAAAVSFYTEKLGFTLSFTWGDPPQMAGVMLDRVQIFLSRGKPNPEGCSIYFPVGDADELYEFHRAGGVEIVIPIDDRDYAMRDYGVRDRDGNRLDFGHPIFNVGPPIEVERVELPIRLEKRLAAVLRDLAASKRMSLTSCLEETLLHTFEPLGDGVASPHTRAQLRLIQELKQKHGIDYDTHASYRFVEVGK
jgi:catechol 2,3-dioxygenase-like lactoylglutathione lyase family enzyme